jgi:archaeal holliday junction resolvase (hjc)
MLERELEKKFKMALEAKGCLVYKFASPNCRGVPDRIVITDAGKVLFVELKTEKGVLSKLQKVQIKKLLAYGQQVFVLYDLQEVEEFVKKIGGDTD